jgi:hypothetical protein
MPKPGYQTTEHALTWAVVALGAVALFRGHDALDRVAALVSPAIASAAYAHSRGRTKSPGPFVDPQLLRDTLRDSMRQQLTELFRGRIVK